MKLDTNKLFEDYERKMIKEYIEFGIDNGYQLLDSKCEKFRVEEEYVEVWDFIDGEELFEKPLHYIITSKEFIEAVARGILKKFKYITDAPDDYINIMNKDGDVTMRLWKMGNGIIDDLCKEQAIAIRDNTLDTFIKSLLDNK